MVRGKEAFAIVFGCFWLLMLAGVGFAYYLKVYCVIDHSSWRNHLLQWWPFVCAVWALAVPLRNVETDTKFSAFGLIGVLLVAMPVGYVLGRMLIFG